VVVVVSAQEEPVLSDDHRPDLRDGLSKQVQALDRIDDFIFVQIAVVGLRHEPKYAPQSSILAVAVARLAISPHVPVLVNSAGKQRAETLLRLSLDVPIQEGPPIPPRRIAAKDTSDVSLVLDPPVGIRQV
jgi:hypothetical protein